MFDGARGNTREPLAPSVLLCVDLARGVCGSELGRETWNPAGVGQPGAGRRRPVRGGVAACSPEAATPTHLHVGHKALLDPPAVFIDLVQEL